MFSREEATAFLTAEKLVNTLTDAANSASYRSALDKIRAVLRGTEQNYLEHIDTRIEVLERRVPATPIGENVMQTVLNAIAARSLLELDYFAYYRQAQTSRQVEPIGVFFLDNYWHLIAWCRSRQAIRDFRFDRISSIRMLEVQFEDVHEPFMNYVKSLYNEMALQPVQILLDQEAYMHLGEQKYYLGLVSEQVTPAGVIMDFMTMSLEGFARWYMSFSDYATILTPEALIEKVRSIHAAAEKKLNKLQCC